ncbi:hypothetical protein GSI_10546 [Ganoderma sinense ZZ0214-1]|uniref:Uncharacterized protein n=1 Tax=Ganoderma sinense ZZ0214-1 TaxID=1077348 RepID=A0A2G8S1G0_9APHY|nr:hypothetical protein GSI_10546 [Ganoderma sinense ZZ0214-1]
MESNYKPSIVADVQRSIGAMNGIVILLQGYQGSITSPEHIERNYPQVTLGQFLTFSSTVVESLGSAQGTVTTWLIETGDRLMTNLNEGRTIEASIKQTTIELGEANYLIAATEDRIRFLNTDIVNLNATLEQAEYRLDKAESVLRRKTRTRDIVRLGGALAIALAPHLAETSFTDVIAIVDREALQAPVEEQKGVVSRITLELDVSRKHLQEQISNLEKERAESVRLSARVSELRQKEKDLAAEARVLETSRATLADLSRRINDCLRSVSVALSSAANISVMRSMQEVVLGLRGVVSALGQDAMFSGPLAQLNDAAFAALDRRIASVRRHRGRVTMP